MSITLKSDSISSLSVFVFSGGCLERQALQPLSKETVTPEFPDVDVIVRGCCSCVSVRPPYAEVQCDRAASTLHHAGLTRVSPPWLRASRGQTGWLGYENNSCRTSLSYSNEEECYRERRVCLYRVWSFLRSVSLSIQVGLSNHFHYMYVSLHLYFVCME